MCRSAKKYVCKPLSPCGWGENQFPKYFFNGIEWKVLICTEQPCFSTSTPVRDGVGDGGPVSKNIFARNCLDCADLFKNIMSGMPLLWSGVGGEGQFVKKSFYARNDVKCPDLHVKVMFQTLTHSHGAGVQYYKIAWNAQLCTWKSCLEPHHHGF